MTLLGVHHVCALYCGTDVALQINSLVLVCVKAAYTNGSN